jgi:signal transduction histidine kinase
VFIDDDVYGTFCFYGTQAREEFSDWEETLVDLMSGWVSYELERRHANEELKETNEQLAQFASVLSHDLRNPLNVAELQTDLAKRECDSEHLDDVEDALDRMNTMIDDLLTLTRGDETDLELDSIDIDAVTDDCWTTVETAEASIEATTDQTIEADEGRLKQIFENVFRNAVEHAGPDVSVTVGALEDGFYIEDDGPGIDESDRERIFEGGYSTSEDGTGLGMSIVEQAAQAHDWEVDVTDGTDGGARVEITGVTVLD